MAITYINKASASNANGLTSASLSPAVPTNTQNGDVMLAFVYKNQTASATLNVPAGWTIVGSAIDNTTLATNCVVYRRTANSEPASYTWSLTGTASIWGVIHATFRGVDTTSPINASNGAATAAATASVAGPSVTTTDRCVIVTFQGTRYGAAQDAPVHSSADTEIDDWGFDGGATSRVGAAYYSAAQAPGTHGRTVTVSPTTNLTGRIMFTVALKEAPEAKSSSDTATATDSQSVLTPTPKSDSDTGSGTDAQSTSATSTRTETSSATDAQSIASSHTGAETTGHVENQSLTSSFSQFDTGSGAEAQSLVVQVSSSDSASATDDGSLSDPTTPTGSESISGAESESLIVNVFGSDSATGVDSSNAPGDVPVEIGDYVVTLVQGPATIYVADYGTTEPTNTNPLTAPWVDLGGTLDGVLLSFVQEYEAKTVEQKPENPASRLKKRQMEVETNLAEPGLNNLLFALNQGSLSSGSGYNSYEPPVIDRATPLTYRTVIIDGWAPDFNLDNRHKRRRVILRKALAVDGTVITYSKGKQTGQDIKWSVHYIDGTTAPFKVIDEV